MHTAPVPSSALEFISSLPNPIRPVGTKVNITCMVQWTEFVDVPISLSIELLDHKGYPRLITAPILNLTSSYRTKSVLMLNSFGRDQSGFYACKANTVLSSVYQTPVSTSRTAVVTVGEIIIIEIKATSDFILLIIMQVSISYSREFSMATTVLFLSMT